MQSYEQFGAWWNLIFLVPFGLGLALVLLSVMGAARHGGSHHGAHHHGAHPHRAHHHGGRHHTHHTIRHTARGSRAAHTPTIPPFMLLQNFCLFWGVCGWTANQIVIAEITPTVELVVVSATIALAGGLLLTAGISSVLARFTPVDESYAAVKTELEGRVGETITPITQRQGFVYARDVAGTLHKLPARTKPGTADMARGQAALVVAYDSENDYYLVKPWNEAEPDMKPDVQLS